ncbi:MAG TPA: hypothetical protein PK576_06005, partial [Kiritimatiellia bacterium]|nr:hypothetical protein [Kiritimatiellia bacterium]
FLGIARVFLERQGEFLIFMKFHVFHGFIQIGVGVAIAIGIDYLTTPSPPHSLTVFEIAGSARISIRQKPMFTGLCWNSTRSTALFRLNVQKGPLTRTGSPADGPQ